jgi:hypothetical protein
VVPALQPVALPSRLKAQIPRDLSYAQKPANTAMQYCSMTVEHGVLAGCILGHDMLSSANWQPTISAASPSPVHSPSLLHSHL